MRPRKVLLMCSSALVVACGGDGDQVAGIDGGGSPAPLAINIVSQGPITGFGSVIVNGVQFDTSNATFTIDGAPGTEADLAVGQIVVIAGTINQAGTAGVATTVDFDDAVEGPIESIDLANDRMIVLGQTVVVSGDTSFEDDINPASLEGLNVGDVVEVSGFVASNGDILASHIELENPGGEVEVTGIVSNVDTAAATLEINSLVVDYSAAMLDGFPNGAPENGQRVEAKGTQFGGAGELLASSLELEDDGLNLDNVDEVEIEGFVTRFASATDFDVNGVAVTTNASTTFEGGASADVALGVRIEVEGSVDGNGLLVADRIEFEREGTIRIGSTVEAIQGNQLTLLGIDVVVNDGTEFDDQSSQDVQNFNIGDVSTGDYLEVRGFDDAGSITVTRLERDDNPGTITLRGIVDLVADPGFEILGIQIATDSNTDFENNAEQAISAADFFAQALGQLVEVEGLNNGGSILADEVEFED